MVGQWSQGLLFVIVANWITNKYDCVKQLGVHHVVQYLFFILHGSPFMCCLGTNPRESPHIRCAHTG